MGKENSSASIPGGFKYDKHWRNCKDYVLSLLKTAGINDKSLENFGVSLPQFSGKLLPFKLKQKKTIKKRRPEQWDCPLTVASQESYKTFSLKEKEELSVLYRQRALKILSDAVNSVINPLAQKRASYNRKAQTPHINNKKHLIDHILGKNNDVNRDYSLREPVNFYDLKKYIEVLGKDQKNISDDQFNKILHRFKRVVSYKLKENIYINKVYENENRLIQLKKYIGGILKAFFSTALSPKALETKSLIKHLAKYSFFKLGQVEKIYQHQNKIFQTSARRMT